MKFAPYIRFIRHFPLAMILDLDKRVTGYYRVCFLSALMGRPFFKSIAAAPMTFEEIASGTGSHNLDALEAWLDFGVSLGVLRKFGSSGYMLKDKLGRRLSNSEAEVWRAYYRLRIEVFQEHILRAPEYLARGESVPLRDDYGSLYADSSRTVEPVLLDVVGRTTPRNGSCRLLEVGCGSGVYLKKACDTNPALTAVGVEMQSSIAELARTAIQEWNLRDRVSVINVDIREYEPSELFDILTVHNLIYYFQEQERAPFLAGLREFLKPGGKIVLSSMCKSPLPSIQAMNLWASMTTGGGPLPEVDEFGKILLEAGFSKLKCREVIPAFWCAEAYNAPASG